MTTRRLRLLHVLAAGALVVAGACNGDDDEGAADDIVDETTTTTAAATTTTEAPAAGDATPLDLTATLSGEEEVPGPGVEDGSGAAEVRLEGNQVCYELNVAMAETPTAAHIHQGSAGEAGPVVVDFEPSFEQGESGFTDEGCVEPADPAILTEIRTEPAGFYVNVHTAEHPQGAVRGQLSPA